MNNFKEEANQFLKENYGIENKIQDDSTESRLEFFKNCRKSDLKKKREKINNILLLGAKSSIDKIINVMIFNIPVEENDWENCTTSLDFSNDSSISNPFNTRYEELCNFWNKDYDEYLEKFGEEGEIETIKKEINYCLQDISKNEELINKSFSHVTTSCLNYILDSIITEDECNEDSLYSSYEGYLTEFLHIALL